jgi:hypothetical protein
MGKRLLLLLLLLLLEAVLRVEEFLDRLRTALRDRSCGPVRQRMIPVAGGKQRRRNRHRPGGPGVLDRGVGADAGGGFPAV